ncbi:TlpA family protein disulfide reductase [Pseudobacter ginsenosidimutans]|nr:thioredoxin family protein [Pseudobacter ginsenosidimutans]
MNKELQKSIYLILFLLISSILLGQGNRVQYNATELLRIYDSLFLANDWRNEYKAQLDEQLGIGWKEKMLKVGDNIPNVLIGELMDSIGSVRLFDLKEKETELIILDFWNTNCFSCIASFPKMESLQAKFGNKVKVLLVNPWQSKEEIRKFFPKGAVLPKLPIIINSTNLLAYFPIQTIPYHVWIGKNGAVHVLGSAYNTYEEKVSKYLRGGDVSYIANESTLPRFEPTLPYFKVLKVIPSFYRYNSFLSPFNPNYATQQPGAVFDLVDSVNGIRRNTLINQSYLNLLKMAWKNEIRENEDKIIISPLPGELVLKVRDTTKYTDYYVNTLKKTDSQYARGRFCYEQIAPMSYTQDQLIDSMRKELEAFGTQFLGAEISFKEDSVLGFVMTHSNMAKVKSKSLQNDELKLEDFMRNNVKMRRYINVSISDIVSDNFGSKLKDDLKGSYFINDSNLDRISFIELPVGFGLNELENGLRKNGFTITKKKFNLFRLYIIENQ